MRPYRKGLEQKIPAAQAPQKLTQGLRANSFLREEMNRVPFWVDSGGVGHSNHHRIADPKSAIPHQSQDIDAYSAAAAREAFGFADDMMKSEMRGTISDLNREPLKTP